VLAAYAVTAARLLPSAGRPRASVMK